MRRIKFILFVIFLSPIILIEYSIDRINDDNSNSSIKNTLLLFGGICLIIGFLIGLIF